ncbi:unnamed protein product [marine sediment metagenome]|uniref:Exonuclease domain-containing protein n=1 Tax=marine sediment metagenome TaxID=412755 RepID=X1D3B7_9ZZZZ
MKWFLCDVETTGLDPERHGITQIAGIVFSGDRLGTTQFKELEAIDLKVAPFPGDEIDPEALIQQGRTKEEIMAYPDPSAAHRELENILGRHVDKFNRKDKLFFAAYNVQFDYQFVRRWFTKCADKYFGSWFWSSPAIDILTVAGLELADRREGMANFKLVTVAETLGIKPEGQAHDAMVDIRMAAQVFQMCTLRRTAHGT